MPKVDGWIFNILIFIGLFILLFAIGSFIPPFFAIFGLLLIAVGIYIGFKPAGTSRKKEISDSREIPMGLDQSKPNEVNRNPVNPARQSESEAVETESRDFEIEKEDNKEEIEEETNEGFGGKTDNAPGWENKTSRKDLALIVLGILFWLISSLVSRIPYLSGIFSFVGILSLGAGLYLLLRRILRAEQVIDNWSILIEKGNGKAEEFFILAEAFIKGSKAPSLRIERKEMSPGVIRGILGTSREFLVATDKNFRLNPYQIFINARDYGENLDVSWYLTYRLPFWRALLRFIPGIGRASFAMESLDLFDRQDLTAYTTICHHSTLEAVGKLMLILNQDPSKIDRKSKGFLGIS